MSFLNRTDELEVPSCPFESITTGVACPTGVTPKMLPIKQLSLTFCTQGADNNDPTCTGHELAGICSQRNVAAATCLVGQRLVADCDVLPSSNVAIERSTAQGRVITADRGVIKRLKTNGGVFLRRWCC